MTTSTSWPRVPLAALPGAAATHHLASAARTLFRGQEGHPEVPVDLGIIAGAARATIRIEPLGAARGRHEGLLVPLRRDKFAIAADPTPPGGWGRVPAAQRDAVKRHRARFRIAHELAHTLTYDRTGPEPRRYLPDSAQQEEWCDGFARALLVPRRLAAKASPTVDGLLRLRSRCDVSLEVAARALAEVQPLIDVDLWHGDGAALVLQWSSTNVKGQRATKDALLAADDRRTARWLDARRQLVRVRRRG